MQYVALVLFALLCACRTTDGTRVSPAAGESLQERESVIRQADSGAEVQVRTAVEGIYAALSAEDPDAVEPFIPPKGYSEFPMTGSLARYDMTSMRSGLTGEVDLQFAIEDLMVEPYGDAAVVTGYRVHSAKMPDGSIEADTRRLSMVCAKMEGQWKLVHVHLSALTNGLPVGSKVEADVRDTHASWFDAILAEDVKALESLLSDDMTFHAPHGGTGYLSVLHPGQLEYDSIAVKQPLIRFHGDTAIVTGQVDILYRWQGQSCFEWLNYTAVWGQASPGWRMLAWQSTYRPDSPCKN